MTARNDTIVSRTSLSEPGDFFHDSTPEDQSRDEAPLMIDDDEWDEDEDYFDDDDDEDDEDDDYLEDDDEDVDSDEDEDLDL